MTIRILMMLIGLMLASVARADHLTPLRSAAVLRSLPHEHEMEGFVRSVFESLGLPNRVPVVIDPEAARSCAYAVTVGGKQYIGVYLPCTGRLRTAEGAYNWHAVGALVHEVAHILAADTTDSEHGPHDEAEADEWAGWQLRRLGATLEEAQTVFRTFSERGSRTHPPRAERLAAVETGWKRAGVAAPPMIQPASPLPSEPAIAQAPSVSVPRSIPAPESGSATLPRTLPAPPTVKEKGWWEELMARKLPWALSGGTK